MNKTISIGILGGASIANRSVIPAIQAIPGYFSLVGIASRSEQKAHELAQKFGTTPFVSYESLLEDDACKAVYIPLPNALHFKFVMAALRAGKHVLVEKSLGCTLEEVQTMTREARERKHALVENFQFRFHSQLCVIKEIVERGEIGELRSMRVSFGFPPFPDANNIRYKAELGGGALLDAGAYPLKIAPYFLGYDVEVVQASLYNDPDKGVDTWGGGALKQINGPLFCHFAFGFDHYYQCALELWGSKGKLFTNRIFTSPTGFQPTVMIETAQGREERSLPADHAFQNMLVHFYNACSDGAISATELHQNELQASLLQQFRNRVG